MQYQVIEQRLGRDERSALLGGRSYPVPSIVEDISGVRLLLVDDPQIPVEIWLWANSAGVAALVNVQAMTFILGTQFSEEYEERSQSRSLSAPERYWRRFEAGMTYLGMLEASEPGAVEEREQPSVPVWQREHAVSIYGDFVHLHTHSEFSQLDGVTRMSEMMDAVTGDGQSAIAITDHGNCAAHPALQFAADKAGVKPIFGMEANFVEDRTVKNADARRAYQHLVLWAMTQEGLKNLWALSTAGYADDAFYDRPRIDWELLERYSDGVMASTACLRGPLLEPFLQGEEERALANLSRLKAIFGNRLYIELHANQLPEQKRANEWLVPLSKQHDVPLVAVVDSHYDGHACDQETHRAWLSVQTKNDIADDNGMFGGGQDYHLMTGAEVFEALSSYLDKDVVYEAMCNTAIVAARCEARIEAKPGKPVFSRPTKEWPDAVAHDVDRLIGLCQERWDVKIPANRDQDEYFARFEREINLLIKKGFCGYFLMCADMVGYAKRNGVLVGPGRGSGGGSLVAYLSGITEIDPVEHDLLFERFMTEGREALPDFDIDYPSSKKQMMFDYVAERWGAQNMAIVGTHMRMKSKGTVNDLSRALKSTLPADYWGDIRKVCEIIDEAEAGTAGLGMAWEDLWVVEHERLSPYREKYPHLFALADRLHGRLKTFGTHPAGIIISTDEPITGSLPLRRGGDDGAPMVTQFDMEALEALGYVKFDLLNLRTLDTLQETVDLIQATTGKWINVYEWTYDEQYADPILYDEISSGRTLGIFQIETSSGTRMCKQFQPENIRELADVITIVRPGPMRSGLTDTYFRRRSGEEEVNFPDPRLEDVLARTMGCMLYQEDIMQTCMVLAGYDSNEADEVRKILGKKKVEKVAAAGEQFLRRAAENGTDALTAKLLWEQMAEFAKYSFNRAHAFAYAILGIWTAWFKFHYPVQFLCAALSTVKAERIAEFVEEARRMGYRILPPDINESARGFSATQMAVRYGLLAVKGVGPAAVDSIMAAREEGGSFVDFEDFLARKGGKCNAGVVKTLARIGAFDSLVPHRRGLEIRMEVEAIGGSDRCIWKTDEPILISGPEIKGQPNQSTLPCSYDWPAEPREPSKQSGRFKAPKPLPKKCTRACRHFTPSELPSYEDVEPYTDEDIRQIELEVLDVFLSSTPFDRIPEEIRATCATGEEVATSESGEYIVPALIRQARKHTDRSGREMAFLKLTTERGELDVTVFSNEFNQYKHVLTSGRLVFAAVRKNARGVTLDLIEDLDATA